MEAACTLRYIFLDDRAGGYRCPVRLAREHRAAPSSRAAAAIGAYGQRTVRGPGDLVVWRPGPGLPASPADRDGAGTRPRARPVRRCRSSRRPTASKPAMTGRPGRSGWARHPSRTTQGRADASWQPAPAPPLPARNAMGDPPDLGIGSDAPGAAVPFLARHAISLDSPVRRFPAPRGVAKELLLPRADGPLAGRMHPDHLAVHLVEHFPAIGAELSLDPDRQVPAALS